MPHGPNHFPLLLRDEAIFVNFFEVIIGLDPLKAKYFKFFSLTFAADMNIEFSEVDGSHLTG